MKYLERICREMGVLGELRRLRRRIRKASFEG